MDTALMVLTIIGSGFVLVWIGVIIVVLLGVAFLGWKDWKHRRALKRAGYIFPGDL